MSRFWRTAFHVQYALLALIDPLMRLWWRVLGVGNVVEVRIPRRDGRGTRSRLLGLLRNGDRHYVGHPNGHVGWTRDLEAAGRATLVWAGGQRRDFHAELLTPGAERDAAIEATDQHPFPGNLVYRLARRHVRVVGVFFRLRFDGEAG